MKKSLSLVPISLLIGLSISFSPAFSAGASAMDKSIPISVATAKTQNLEVWQISQGKLLAKTSPTIAAEVAGRIVSVKVDVGQEVKSGQILAEIDAVDFHLVKALVSADMARLQALIKVQQLQVKRFQNLVRQKSANQSALDNAEAQLGSLKAQWVGAKVRLQQAERDIAKTRIISPVSGRVNERRVSVGDYLNAGTPLFQITTLKTLQARLPYPEALASQLHVGLPARLTSPVMPGERVESQISDISPEISPSNLAIYILIDLQNPGGWEPGASVTGEVRVAERVNAVVVPEGCVIRRASGLVVYKVNQGQATEIAVMTGLHDNGMIEILSGVQAGDQLALDGAAYLADGVSVDIKATTSQSDAQ